MSVVHFSMRLELMKQKNCENSLLLWEIHHGADILVFAPVELISDVMIDIFYHLGSISFTYSVSEKIP